MSEDTNPYTGSGAAAGPTIGLSPYTTDPATYADPYRFRKPFIFACSIMAVVLTGIALPGAVLFFLYAGIAKAITYCADTCHRVITGDQYTGRTYIFAQDGNSIVGSIGVTVPLITAVVCLVWGIKNRWRASIWLSSIATGVSLINLVIVLCGIGVLTHR